MSQLGSYLRFFIGLALSIEIIRQLVIGNISSNVAIVLSLAYIALSALFFIGRI